MRNTVQKQPAYSSSMHQLVMQLSRAQTLKSMADSTANYCSKIFRDSAGMVFVGPDGGLQLVSQWCCGQIPKKNFADDLIKNSSVSRALRTGEALVLQQERALNSRASRHLGALLRKYQCHGVSFIPICAPGQKPSGVIVIVLRDAKELSAVVRDDLLRLGQIVAGCIERARAYDAALAARVNAENASRRKDEFISILSHELKNPMMPILGWAVALSSGTLPEAKQNQAIDGIVRNVRVLNYLIEDLFDAARISSGKLRLQPGETRIQEVAREALATIQHTAEDKKLRVSTDISEAIPTFTADSRRLQQVLINLLNNAVKFTPEGGGINLKVRKRGMYAECVVSDTGKGIERKFLPFVFDRFRQEDRPSKIRTGGGLGLGLGIVREIVALHNGSIKALSDGPNRGSTFILRLPLQRKGFKGAI